MVFLFRILVDYVVKIREAVTQSRLSEFLPGLCKTGPVLQPKGEEH